MGKQPFSPSTVAERFFGFMAVDRTAVGVYEDILSNSPHQTDMKRFMGVVRTILFKVLPPEYKSTYLRKAETSAEKDIAVLLSENAHFASIRSLANEHQKERKIKAYREVVRLTCQSILPQMTTIIEALCTSLEQTGINPLEQP